MGFPDRLEVVGGKLGFPSSGSWLGLGLGLCGGCPRTRARLCWAGAGTGAALGWPGAGPGLGRGWAGAGLGLRQRLQLCLPSTSVQPAPPRA